MRSKLRFLTFSALLIICIARRGGVSIQYHADQYFSAGNRAGNSEDDEDELDKAAELADNEIGDSLLGRQADKKDEEVHAYMGQTCGATTGSSSEVEKMAIKLDVWEHAGCLGCTTEELDTRYGTRRRGKTEELREGTETSNGGPFLSTTGSFTLSSGGGGGTVVNSGCCDHMLLKLKSNGEVWFAIQNAPANQATLNSPPANRQILIGKKGECLGKCEKMVPALENWFSSVKKEDIEKCVSCTRAVAASTRI